MYITLVISELHKVASHSDFSPSVKTWSKASKMAAEPGVWLTVTWPPAAADGFHVGRRVGAVVGRKREKRSEFPRKNSQCEFFSCKFSTFQSQEFLSFPTKFLTSIPECIYFFLEIYSFLFFLLSATALICCRIHSWSSLEQNIFSKKPWVFFFHWTWIS